MWAISRQVNTLTWPWAVIKCRQTNGFFTFQPQSIEYNHRYVQNRHFSIPPSVYSHPRKKLSLSVCSSVRSFICYKTCERDIFKTNRLNRFWCQLVHGASSCNKCIGDDTKAAARQSPNCIKKQKKIWRKTIFNMGDGILTPCYNKCIKKLFGFQRLDSMSGISYWFASTDCWYYCSQCSFFIARQHTDGRYWYSKSVRLSVPIRLSITFRYHLKTA